MEMKTVIEEGNGKKPSLLGMISSPSVQFERMKTKTPVAFPLIIMLIITAVTGALVSYISLGNPLLKEATAASGVQMPVGLTIGAGAFGSIFGGAIVYLIAAGIYKLFMVIFGNDTSYKKLFALVVFSSIISSLGLLVNGLIALAVGGYEPIYTSLAPLAGENKLLSAIFKNFDIFTIWYYVVLALGFRIVAGLSKNKAILIVVIVFLLSIGFSSLSGLIAVPGK
ncbi:Yip1 family protein [Neobacillus sp. SM06]|uniref:Yip1 family protein n=1 Tax=Neobacillus sp. SM06 TaxID=3422492 RepID=UPI003D27E680